MQFEHYPPDGNASYGVGVAIPLLWGNDYHGETARAEAEYTAAMQDVERARAAAASDGTRIRAELAAARERVKRNREVLVPAAERAAAAQDFAYRKGATSVLDLLDAHRSLRAAQAEALDAQAAYARAWYAVRLELAGIGSAPQ